MPRHEPSTRIGEAERTAAQRALQEHLNAERLLVTEYAERSAAAAGATTAAEIEALFTDLPAPHPRLPGSPGRGPRRALVVVGVVVAVALVAVLAFAIGRGGQPTAAAGSAPVPAPVPTTRTAPPTTSSLPDATPGASAGATPSATSGGTGRPLPGGAQVRRTTGDQPITLSPYYSVDLDDGTSPNWDASRGGSGDVFFDHGSEYVSLSSDYAVMAGPADYTACSQETAYTNGRIERGSLTAGQDICVRTTGDRFAVVTVVGVSDQAFQFRATVWDPQFD
ncbi:DUF1707 SHOCT-like domain-containing protein [Pseudonocardia lacus]|uniref:DUF1707 SHOCT-like domain-containing protein n=1 Tax=Pseudonocardia lacus TaxID=2835865 RepID=UPI001BDBF1FA|nr:DUF1707 domain-containing protein [Pseudonocardia lacus]